MTEGTLMILIVTHEVEFGKKISHWLQERHYVVSFSQGGGEALELAVQISPALVVVDMYLQNPSGLEILRQLRSQGFGGKVVLLGGFSVSPEVPEALHLGVDQVLGRPLTLGQVESAIRSAIGALQPKDPAQGSQKNPS
jgi:two-component system response regulator YesN